MAGPWAAPLTLQPAWRVAPEGHWVTRSHLVEKELLFAGRWPLLGKKGLISCVTQPLPDKEGPLRTERAGRTKEEGVSEQVGGWGCRQRVDHAEGSST